MESIKYGDSSTYTDELDKENLEWISNMTNRSRGQTQFLFQLVNGDFEKLKQLEIKIKNCFISYCPGCIEEVNKILLMKSKSDYFTL